MERSGGRDHEEETECTLAVVCPDPRAVFERILSTKRLDGLDLVREASHRIHDRYLDTADRRFGREGFALRIRDRDGAERIALKGPTETGDDGVQRRLEIEAERSPSGVRRIAGALRDEGLLPEGNDESGGSPDEPFGSLDLKWVHTRRIHRDRLAVRDPGGVVLCEVTLDEVTFPVAGGEMRHFEVEIEAAVGGSSETVVRLAGLLAGAHPELRPWPWSKLQTGTVLQAMARDGALPTVEEAGPGDPIVRRYNEIEARLRRESFRAVDGARS